MNSNLNNSGEEGPIHEEEDSKVKLSALIEKMKNEKELQGAESNSEEEYGDNDSVNYQPLKGLAFRLMSN